MPALMQIKGRMQVKPKPIADRGSVRPPLIVALRKRPWRRVGRAEMHADARAPMVGAPGAQQVPEPQRNQKLNLNGPLTAPA